MPELSEEPQIIEHADKSFSLSWWPHQIYHINSDLVFNRASFAKD